MGAAAGDSFKYLEQVRIHLPLHPLSSSPSSLAPQISTPFPILSLDIGRGYLPTLLSQPLLPCSSHGCKEWLCREQQQAGGSKQDPLPCPDPLGVPLLAWEQAKAGGTHLLLLLFPDKPCSPCSPGWSRAAGTASGQVYPYYTQRHKERG